MYEHFKELNGLYSRSNVVEFLDNMNPLEVEEAIKNEPIEINVPSLELNNETSFEAQLNRLDFNELKEIVFCWPNSGGNRLFEIPLETGCCSDHRIVYLEETKIETLYADLRMGFVHLTKFDIKDISLWKLVREKLNGRRLERIVDCSDGNWSEVMFREEYKYAFETNKELVEVTKYIQKYILEDQGEIICSANVSKTTFFDFEKFYAMSNSGL